VDLCLTQINGFRTLRIWLDFERDALAFGETTHASRLDSGSMNKHVFGAIFRRDKAEALANVEKLWRLCT
jgi:hypothetical protein